MNYNPDMSAADKESESLLFVVPTGDADTPLTIELGYWDAAANRWTGEWRHTEDPETHELSMLAQNDPIAWAPVPEIDDSLYPKSAAA